MTKDRPVPSLEQLATAYGLPATLLSGPTDLTPEQLADLRRYYDNDRPSWRASVHSALADLNETMVRLWLDSGPSPTKLMISSSVWKRLRSRPRLRALARQYAFRRLAVRRRGYVRRRR